MRSSFSRAVAKVPVIHFAVYIYYTLPLRVSSPGLKFLIWITGMIIAPTSLGPSIVKYEGNDACGECRTMVTSMFSTHVSNDYCSYSCLELSLHNRLTPPKGWNWSVIIFSLTLYLAQSTCRWASATMFLLTMAWNSNAGCGTSPSNSRPIHLWYEYRVLGSLSFKTRFLVGCGGVP